jgi:hypothetical protein
MHEGGCTKSNSRITVENEPMKYWSKEVYADMINQTYAKVAGRWYVGAGNEEFGLSEARGGMYQYILENSQFDYLDIHIQATMIDPEPDWRVNFDRVRHWLLTSKTWASAYGKKLSCTEANWSKIKTENGHKDLMEERRLAKLYGCEDFNIVFIDTVNTTKHWLDYQIRGVQNSPYWPDLRQKMLDEKKETKGSVDGMIIKTIGHKTNDVKSGYGCLLLNETLNFLEFLDEDYVNFQYSAETREALEDWQSTVNPTYNNAIDGRCGRMTWRYLKKEVKKISVDAYKDLSDDLEIIMSPYNTNGDT